MGYNMRFILSFIIVGVILKLFVIAIQAPFTHFESLAQLIGR